MCLSYCHRRGVLYDNHLACQAALCSFVGDDTGGCETCCHRQGGYCGLTRYPLPEKGGCCHWNIPLRGDQQVITLSDLKMVGVGWNETVGDVLTGFEIPYEVDEAGSVWLDPAILALPVIYGEGWDH